MPSHPSPCYNKCMPRISLTQRILQHTRPLTRVPILGLDISDRSAKFFAFRLHSTGISVNTYGDVIIPEGIIESGEIKDENALSEILKKRLANEPGHLPEFTAIALPEEQSFLRVVQLPHIKKEQVEEALTWEIENNIPLPAAELSYNYTIMEPVEDAPDHLDVLLVALPREVVDPYLRIIESIDLKPAVVELESHSLMRSIVPFIEPREACIAIDLGRERTGITIIASGIPILTTTVPVGGRLFEQNIAKALSVDQKEAEHIKKTVGLQKEKHEGKVYTALMPVIGALADELKKTIAYYEAHPTHTHGANHTIGTILLAGGDASLIGLEATLSSILRIRTITVDPFAGVQPRLTPRIPPLLKNEALAYATAIGLALTDLE